LRSFGTFGSSLTPVSYRVPRNTVAPVKAELLGSVERHLTACSQATEEAMRQAAL
jgi:hypothetical protein